MDSRQIIYIVAIISVIFGNPESGEKKIHRLPLTHKVCVEQLKIEGFQMDFSIIQAFTHALKTIVIHSNKEDNEISKGKAYQYHEYLYNAGILCLDNFDDPITWCCNHSGRFSNLSDEMKKTMCESEMKAIYSPDLRKDKILKATFDTFKFDKNEIKYKGDIVRRLLGDYILYFEPILTKCVGNSGVLTPKEFCDDVQNSPQPKRQRTDPGNASNSQPDVDEPVPPPELQRTEQVDPSNSEANESIWLKFLNGTADLI